MKVYFIKVEVNIHFYDSKSPMTIVNEMLSILVAIMTLIKLLD